ncbi:hypothetical protein [Terracidiphilus sp.]|jgi:hypothetical protein|uniref:hypothetical protein n=1 Tax=Terracidiphilus sp. TaxID=1964191 RepID=UPI003C23E885
MQAFRPGSHIAPKILLAAACLTATLASAQAPAAPHAPIPPAILAARKLFIANGGADAGLFPSPFSGSTSHGYDQFYSAFRGMSQYDLVSNPSEADLVLEFQIQAPLGPANADKSKGAADPLPTVSVKIYDRPSHYVLWAFSEEVDIAFLQKTHDRNLDDAIARLAQDFQSLTRPQSTTPPTTP